MWAYGTDEYDHLTCDAVFTAADIIELFEEIILDNNKAEEIGKQIIPVFERNRATR